MKGGSDAVNGGLRPWWRSVGVLLGLPGLVFLLWVWRDSLTNVSVVGSEVRIRGRAFGLQAFQPEVCVQRGCVFYHRSRVTDSSPDIVVSKDPLRFQRQKELAVPMKKKEEGRYGFEVIEREMPVSPSRLRAKAVDCWFPIWFVVAGYVVVWTGSLVMWRWWMWRRWKASQVVEG